MKLYEVPNRTFVKIVEGTDDVYFFDHPDGSYSFCKDACGNIVHIYISEEVEIVNLEY